MLARLTGALAAVLCSTVSVSAQATILVLDSEGNPIPAVRVDLFGTAELLGTFSTTVQGLAELTSERWPEARRLTLNHLAFQTLVVQLADLPSDGTLRMEARAIEMEGFTIAGADLCPVVDDPAARRIWTSTASRYASRTGSRAWSAYLSRGGGRVLERNLHRTDDLDFVDYVAAGQPFVIHGGDHTPRSLEERVAYEGYAWEPLVVAGTTRRRESGWGYPDFDREHAYHFASAAFGTLHDFAISSESATQTTLTFCGRAKEAPTIHGAIQLVPGEAFLSAEWRFHTPEPNEAAGGWVEFRSYIEPSEPNPHLVASRGLFYRRLEARGPYEDLRTYLREVTGGVGWYLHPSIDHPCNEGVSFFTVPPTSPAGVRFATCVAEHWGRD